MRISILLIIVLLSGCASIPEGESSALRVDTGCAAMPKGKPTALRIDTITPEEVAALFQRLASEQTVTAKPSRRQLYSIILSDVDDKLRQRSMKLIADERDPANIDFFAQILNGNTEQCRRLYEYAVNSLVLIHDKRVANIVLDFIESPTIACDSLRKNIGLRLASAYSADDAPFREIHDRLRVRSLSEAQACWYLHALAGYSFIQGRKVDSAVVTPYLDRPSLKTFTSAILALSVGGHPEYLERLGPYVDKKRGIEGRDLACYVIFAYHYRKFPRSESSRTSKDWNNGHQIRWYRTEMAKKKAANQ